jgi:hypothetical protein
MRHTILAKVSEHAEQRFVERLHITKYKRDKTYDFSNYYVYVASKFFYCHKDKDSTYCDYYVCVKSRAVLCVNHNDRIIRTIMTDGPSVDYFYNLYDKIKNRAH